MQFHRNDLQFRSFSGVSMVTLLVGEGETPFNIHVDLLCEASPFFNSAFMGTGNFKEASTKSMKLPEDDPATMDKLIQWIYFGRYSIDMESKTKSLDQLCESLNTLLMPFATLYVAADKYGIIELKNHAIDRMFDLAMQTKDGMATIHEDLIEYIYKNTITGSTLRKLLVEWHVWLVPWYFTNHWTENQVRNHVDFTVDVLAQFEARVGGKLNPFKRGDQYKFHEKLGAEVSDSSKSSDSSEIDSDSDSDDEEE
ncbi:MAG: hypothetical protein Q9195_008613 [Heterodermia aff. obscurata]